MDFVFNAIFWGMHNIYNDTDCSKMLTQGIPKFPEVEDIVSPNNNMDISIIDIFILTAGSYMGPAGPGLKGLENYCREHGQKHHVI